MKKFLSVLAVLGVVSFGVQSANAFCWSSLNPAYWGHCPKCQKVKKDCGCHKKTNPCDETITGGAADCDHNKKVKNPCKKEKSSPCHIKQQTSPCNPCEKQKEPCEPCEQLQEMNK